MTKYKIWRKYYYFLYIIYIHTKLSKNASNMNSRIGLHCLYHRQCVLTRPHSQTLFLVSYLKRLKRNIAYSLERRIRYQSNEILKVGLLASIQAICKHIKCNLKNKNSSLFSLFHSFTNSLFLSVWEKDIVSCLYKINVAQKILK